MSARGGARGSNGSFGGEYELAPLSGRIGARIGDLVFACIPTVLAFAGVGTMPVRSLPSVSLLRIFTLLMGSTGRVRASAFFE